MLVCPECGQTLSGGSHCPHDGTGLADAGDDILLGTQIGPYRIAKLLGVGGMGRVYKGTHPQIGSRVAVKVLSRECAERPELVERFFAEARAVNLIRHENIVNVLDLAMLPDGRPYIIMEYLDGSALSDIIARLRVLPLGGVIRLANEVLGALGAAHAKGIVHRDLKPDNIFVSPNGRAKVLDFGIAKLMPGLGGTSTKTGSLLGTPHYMSPEQALGQALDPRTDLYAMGVILFEAVTGQRPFDGTSLFDLLRRHVDEPPARPISLRPDLPPILEHVILTALAKDPAHRYPHAAAMNDALSEASRAVPPEQWVALTPTTAPMNAAHAPSGSTWPSGVQRQFVGPTLDSPRRSQAQSAPPPFVPPPVSQATGPAPAPWHGQPEAQRMPTTVSGSAGQLPIARPAKPAAGRGPLWITLALVGIAGGATAIALNRGGEAAPTTPTVAAGTGAVDSPVGPPVVGSAGAGPLVVATGSAGSSTSGSAAPVTPTTPVNPANGPIAEVPEPSRNPPVPDKPTPTPTPAPPAPIDTTGVKLTADDQELLKSLKTSLASMQQYRTHIPATSIQQIVDGWQDPLFQNLLRSDPEAWRLYNEVTQGFTPTKVAVSTDPNKPWLTPSTVARPSSWNSERFDISSFLKSAIAAAQDADAGAWLFRLDAEAVRPDGTVDLTAGSSTYVDYRFVAPAHTTRPTSIPRGADYNWQCQVRVWVEAKGISRRLLEGWDCDDMKKLALPRCTIKQVWQKAIAEGAPATNVIADIGFRADFKGLPTWYFTIDDEFSKQYRDDC